MMSPGVVRDLMDADEAHNNVIFCEGEQSLTKFSNFLLLCYMVLYGEVLLGLIKTSTTLLRSKMNVS